MNVSRRALLLSVWLVAGWLPAEEKYHSGDFRGPESCAECHPRHYQEWRGSAHAYSIIDPVVQACIRLAQRETGGRPAGGTGGEIGALCIGCHAPIGARTGELKPDFKTLEGVPRVIQAGISCTVCHRMQSPDDGERIGNASFNIKPGNVYYGRLYRPDLTPAHGSDRSEFMGSSVLCGSCHDVLGEKEPLEKTYAEWSASIHRERDTQCQNCHMLRYSGQAARGGPFRDTLHRHNFPAVTLPLIRFPNRGYQMEEIQRFLRTAARMDVVAPHSAVLGKTFRLIVNVKNSGAGHNLPSGISALRQMWLEVTARDSRGRTLFRSGHLDGNGDLMDHYSSEGARDPALVNFADRFLDADGNQVFFFWQADRLDERSLKPMEERSLCYEFPLEKPLIAGDQLSVQVRLLFRPLPPYILRHLGLGNLVKKLPLWEMDAVRFPSIPVVEKRPPGTIRVPLEFEEIQAAIDASQDGDTILVATGEYAIRRPLDFRGKAITVRSAAGATHTTLRLREPVDADRGSVVVFQSGETAATRLEGFTLAGGTGTMVDGFRRGGGILTRGSSATIAGNRIQECSAQGGVGGGICIDGGAPTLRDNIVESCVAERGGGIAIRSARRIGTNGKFDANIIRGNAARSGGGIYIESRTAVIMERCLVAGNIALADGGGCFAAERAHLEARNVTVTQNRAGHKGGGVHRAPAATISVTHSIFWDNDPGDGVATYRYSIISTEPTGATNLSQLPLFRDPSGFWKRGRDSTDPAAPTDPTDPTEPGTITLPGRWQGGDYHLLPGSPAVDAGDPLATPDPDDSRRDLGAYFLEQPRKAFIRGDTDGNGKLEWADLLLLGRHLLEPPDEACRDAADVDDSGRITVADGVRLGIHLMTGRAAPEAPYPECGVDPTFAEGLPCDRKGDPCQGAGRQ